ncbi:hypothetical protein ACSHWO_16665 [Streptomyces sp. HUAS TT3]|uniref:hypothetical protein n=1 Tax=Streptomyces sp. HUAS TT3 TaxID=3447510 RepID=UPI003F65B00C
MPIDPYAALNAMIRAEVTRSTPPPRTKPKPAAAPSPEPEETAAASEAGAAPETAAHETAVLYRSGTSVPAPASED